MCEPSVRPLPRSFTSACGRTCGATAVMRLCRRRTSTEFDTRASDRRPATPASRTTLRRSLCGASLRSVKRLVRISSSSSATQPGCVSGTSPGLHHCCAFLVLAWWTDVQFANSAVSLSKAVCMCGSSRCALHVQRPPFLAVLQEAKVKAK